MSPANTFYIYSLADLASRWFYERALTNFHKSHFRFFTLCGNCRRVSCENFFYSASAVFFIVRYYAIGLSGSAALSHSCRERKLVKHNENFRSTIYFRRIVSKLSASFYARRFIAEAPAVTTFANANTAESSFVVHLALFRFSYCSCCLMASYAGNKILGSGRHAGSLKSTNSD